MRRTKAEALETREALLDASEALFVEKGVSGTSLTDIAKAAGLTRGAIYWHFADKAALFEAMQQRAWLPQEYVARLLEGTRTGDPLQAIHDVAIECLRNFAADERSQRVYTIMLLRCEYVGEMSGVLQRMREADKLLTGAVHAAFADAQARGLLSENWTAETASLAHISIVTGLFNQWLRGERGFDLLEVGIPMLEAMRRAVSANVCVRQRDGLRRLAVG